MVICQTLPSVYGAVLAVVDVVVVVVELIVPVGFGLLALAGLLPWARLRLLVPIRSAATLRS